jgi:endonuclease YncB( thermonuclease family)
MKPTDAFVRRARLVEVLDGDTYRLDIDCGFDTWRRVDVRLRGIDCPERGTDRGQLAKRHARALLMTASAFGDDSSIVVQTQRTKTGADVRSFVRYVADVWVDGVPLAETLRAAGHVK